MGLEDAARFRALIDSAHDVIGVADETGTTLYVNDSVRRVLGWEPSELVGTNVLSLVAEEDLPLAGAALLEAVSSDGQEPRIECRVKTKGGGLRTLEIVGKGIIGPDARRQVIVNARDVTERRRAEAERDRFFTMSADLLGVVTIDGRFARLNPAWERVLGFSLAELYATPGLKLVHPDDRGPVLAIGRELLGGKDARCETRFVTKDGSYRLLAWTCRAPERGEAEFYVVGRDITEQRVAEERLREAQKMEAVGRLAGGVAHDFNNLLMAILGYAGLLVRRIDAESAIARDVIEIQRAGERAAALTRQLLAFSRKQVLKPRVFELDEAVRDVETLLRRLIGEDVDLVVELAAPGGRVRADRAQIEQVIVNLCLNARDAMPSGGRITIATSEARRDDEPHLRLSVGDTGVGMDRATRDRLFEPFFTTKERGKGTGLGLATVYGIVKQSGGSIAVESELGRGSTFRIDLPSVEEPAESLPLGESVMPRGSETILVVEDEDAVRGLVVDVLQRCGYRVLSASRGDDALALLASEPSVDLLLTDVVMPVMSGRDLAIRARAIRPELPVLYMSGYLDDVLGKDGVLAADAELLSKPITPEALAMRVRRALDAGGRSASQ